MRYIFVFLGYIFTFGGRPTVPSKFFTFSTTPGAYTFVLPTFLTGFILSILIRLFTVSKESIPAFSAISLTVNSFITPISVILTQKLRRVNKKPPFTIHLDRRIRKKIIFFDRNRLNMLDNLTDIGYIIVR